jgi:predicted nuclease of predicted toxin-antitoxin system
MLAFYQDAAEDDWPMYAIEGQPTFQDRVWRFRLYDDEAIYTFDTVPREGERVTYITTDTHAIGVTPIVRFANQIDLDGRSVGEVEPFIPLISRIDQDTFDRLVVQRFQSWAVRWITGLVLPDQREEAQKEKLRLRAEDILIAPDPDTKIGALPAGDLGGLIQARDADIKDLAAVSQTPPHYLLGQIINVSAEALAAAEAALNRKVEERKHIFGEAAEQTLRLAAHLAGDSEEAEDVASEVRWRDMEARSLAQVADALGKMATMLGVPVEALWEKIPGTTLTEVNRWAELRRRDDVLGQMLAQIAPDAPAATP